MAREDSAVLVRSRGGEIPWGAFRVDLASAHVVALLYRVAVDRWLAEWEEHVGAEPASMRILATDAEGAAARTMEGRTVTEVPPGNLTQVGVEVTSALQEIGDADQPVVVYLDSLTAMLQFVDLTTAYRFLHTLVGHVDAADGTTYVGMDPSAHDETTVATVLQLFDDVRKG